MYKKLYIYICTYYILRVGNWEIKKLILICIKVTNRNKSSQFPTGKIGTIKAQEVVLLIM